MRYKSRLTAVEMRYIRKMCGYSIRDKMRNVRVYGEYKMNKSIMNEVEDNTERLFTFKECLIRIILNNILPGYSRIKWKNNGKYINISFCTNLTTK